MSNEWFFHYFILIYKRKYYTTYVTQDKPCFSPAILLLMQPL